MRPRALGERREEIPVLEDRELRIEAAAIRHERAVHERSGKMDVAALENLRGRHGTAQRSPRAIAQDRARKRADHAGIACAADYSRETRHMAGLDGVVVVEERDPVASGGVPWGFMALA